jgi:hypothetical protein
MGNIVGGGERFVFQKQNHPLREKIFFISSHGAVGGFVILPPGRPSLSFFYNTTILY